MSLNLSEYKDGFHRGWDSVYEQKGRSAPNPPAVRNPPAKRSADKRTDYERGYMQGLTEAQERISK